MIRPAQVDLKPSGEGAVKANTEAGPTSLVGQSFAGRIGSVGKTLLAGAMLAVAGADKEALAQRAGSAAPPNRIAAAEQQMMSLEQQIAERLAYWAELNKSLVEAQQRPVGLDQRNNQWQSDLLSRHDLSPQMKQDFTLTLLELNRLAMFHQQAHNDIQSQLRAESAQQASWKHAQHRVELQEFSRANRPPRPPRPTQMDRHNRRMTAIRLGQVELATRNASSLDRFISGRSSPFLNSEAQRYPRPTSDGANYGPGPSIDLGVLRLGGSGSIGLGSWLGGKQPAVETPTDLSYPTANGTYGAQSYPNRTGSDWQPVDPGSGSPVLVPGPDSVAENVAVLSRNGAGQQGQVRVHLPPQPLSKKEQKALDKAYEADIKVQQRELGLSNPNLSDRARAKLEGQIVKDIGAAEKAWQDFYKTSGRQP